MLLSRPSVQGNVRFSKRTADTMESYIMKLISVANEPGMISFATGLPDKRLFDTSGIAAAADEVLHSTRVNDALQYGVTEGLLSLRRKIADRCRKELGFDTGTDNVFIMNGSQECFDLLGKLFLDRKDKMIVENPGYLGALQSFSVYGPKFSGVDLNDNGPDMTQMEKALRQDPKLYYAIPNYQNPSGMCYSDDARKQIAGMMSDTDCMMIEDDAYGELGFRGRTKRTIRSMNENVIMTGSFSKIISPGMRIGWMIVPDELVPFVKRSLEASCLHANTFSQAVMDRFLENNDLSKYLIPIRREYQRKCRLMLDLLKDSIPQGRWNEPEGGMFIWFRTPDGTDAMRLYEAALKEKVVIMPGRPFHVRGGGNTIRLNYATASDEEMKEGMGRLARAFSSVF